MDKPTLRRELRALSRERLTDELRLTGSASIISQLRQHPLWQTAQHVALYAALPDEPNLRTLIDEVATTKQVYLPASSTARRWISSPSLAGRSLSSRGASASTSPALRLMEP